MAQYLNVINVPKITENSFLNVIDYHHMYLRWQMFFKRSALDNFVIFPGKHLCWSLQTCNFILKRGSKTGACKIIA